MGETTPIQRTEAIGGGSKPKYKPVEQDEDFFFFFLNGQLSGAISGFVNNAVYTGGPISFKSGNTDSGAFHG